MKLVTAVMKALLTGKSLLKAETVNKHHHNTQSKASNSRISLHLCYQVITVTVSGNKYCILHFLHSYKLFKLPVTWTIHNHFFSVSFTYMMRTFYRYF